MDNFLSDATKHNLDVLTNVNLKELNHFKIGGNAQYFSKPSRTIDLQNLLKIATKHNIKITVLGDGSNVLISDKGIKGLVISTISLYDTEDFTTIRPNVYRFNSSVLSSDLAIASAKKGLAGCHNFYGLPGTLGGACFMNARCYGAEIAQVFDNATVLTYDGQILNINKNDDEWGYKKSPFQDKKYIIISVDLKLESHQNSMFLIAEAEAKMADRINKGHFLYPSAGSTFKNNYSFSAPTGTLLDSLGLKGFSIGGASIADFHANIFINKNNASSDDMLNLINYAKKLASEKLSIELEAEVIYLE